MTALRNWSRTNNVRHEAERARLDALGGEHGDFLRFAGRSVAAHNLHALKVRTCCALDAVASAYHYELDASGGDEAKADSAYRARQATHFGRRENVEAAMGVRRSAIYAALVGDGLGVPYYGPFTFVFDADDTLVEGVLRFNSAEHYADDMGVVDQRALQNDAGTWVNRDVVSTLKHESSFQPAMRIDWISQRESMLVTDVPKPEFVEVVIDGPRIPLATCRTVRIARTRLDELDAIDADDAGGNPPTTQKDREALDAYRLLRARSDAGLLTIEGV